MPDLLQTAVKYRNRLKAELAKVEDFLRMAEEFAKDTDSDGRLVLPKGMPAGAPSASTTPPPPPEPNPVDRLRSAAKAAAGA
jgi:hypothetical protein